MIRAGAAALVGCLLSTPSFAVEGANAGSARNQPRTTEQVDALLRDFDTAGQVAALGRLFYEADDTKHGWGRYCSNSLSLANRGEFRLAVREASKALYLGQQSANYNALAHASRDLAYIYNLAGDFDRALHWANETLTIARSVDSSVARGRLLFAPAYKVRANVYLRKGMLDEAIRDYELALSNLPFMSSSKPYVILALANAHLARKNFGEAQKLFDQYEASGDTRARVLASRGLGELALQQKQPELAARRFAAAQELAQAGKLDYLAILARDGAARAKLAAGDQEGALAEFRGATQAAERLRGTFESTEIRAGFFGDVQSAFDESIALLVKRGQFDEALALSEQSRSRTLGDQVRNRVGTRGASLLAAPFSVDKLRERLPKDTAVVVYHVLTDAVVAWIVRQEGTRGAALPATRRGLGTLVTALREAMALPSGKGQPAAEQLYGLLVKPLDLKEGETVVFVPHKMLHHVPFAALRSPTQWLIEERPVATAVSLDTIDAGLQRPLQSEPASAFALGNPDVGDEALALPGAELEVKQLAAQFPNSLVYTRKDATRARFLERAAASRIVHVAAHAYVDDIDPMFSYIRLAQGAEKSGDVEAHEIYKINFAGARIVTLSTCNSGMGRVSLGDEFWGFKRSFIAAGARSLLLSLWPIADESTPQLMKSFYDRIQSGPAAEALRAGQLELIKSAGYSDPTYWAPFVLVGDWR